MANKVFLAGYAGNDPELRYTDGGTAVANLRLATGESYTDSDGNRVERTEWHSLVFWGRKAEVINEYLSKGDFLIVNNGKLQTRSWEDRDDNTRYSTEVKVIEFEFGPNNGDGDQDSSTEEVPAGEAPDPNEDTFEPDDDLPF